MEIKLDFNKMGGLIPAIVQDEKTGEVLMLAFMNEESWNKTLQTKKAHYYSRSRNKLWMKGEESGNIQEVKDILIDCDEDTILLKVYQVGDAACHTGNLSCFFRKLVGDEFKSIGVKVFNPEEKYGKA